MRKWHSAFTLAEIIVVLTVLGIVSTFSIPKILGSQQEARKKAVYKQLFSTLTESMYEGIQTRVFTNSSSNGIRGNIIRFYLEDRLSAVKFCGSGDSTCWTHPLHGGASPGYRGAWVFHDNSVLTVQLTSQSAAGDSNAVNGWLAHFICDYNGAEGPNLYGEDQIFVKYNLGTNLIDGVSGRRMSAPTSVPGYTIPENAVLYASIYN